MIGKREMKEHRRAKVPDISRQNEQVSRGLQNETSAKRSSMRRDQTLRLFREMSVLEVYLESAAALMTNSFARGGGILDERGGADDATSKRSVCELRST